MADDTPSPSSVISSDPIAGSPPPPRVERGPIGNYFYTLLQILIRPSEFFRNVPHDGGLSGPLAFALVTHWAGSGFELIWRAAVGGAMNEHIQALIKQLAPATQDVDNPGRGAMLQEAQSQVLQWLFGAGSVIADPFFTLIKIGITALLVFVAARIFVSPYRSGFEDRAGGQPPEITYESTLRIICYGMAPSILGCVPFMGGIIAMLYATIVTIIGFREAYRIPIGLAIVVALFPKILFFGAILMIATFFLVLFVKLFAAAM